MKSRYSSIGISQALCCLLFGLNLSAHESRPVQEHSRESTYHFNRYQKTLSDLGQPRDAVFNSDGNLFLTETSPPLVRVISSETWETIQTIEHESLIHPSGIAMGPNGDLYVADSHAHTIFVFNRSFKEKKRYGTRGHGLGELFEPEGIFVAHDSLYVADAGNDRVQVFSLSDDGGSEESVHVIGSHGDELSHFIRPSDVLVDGSGIIHVVDRDKHRVQRFDSSGKFHSTFGDYGHDPGLMSRPMSIDIYGDEIFVADSENHRISVFDPLGNFRFSWGLHALEPFQGEGHLHYPNAVAIHPKGTHAIVVELAENRVQIFSEEPDSEAERLYQDQALFGTSVAAHLGRWPTFGDGLLAIDEPETHTVRLLRMLDRGPPALIHRLGGYGDTPGAFNGIGGIAWDTSKKRLYVSDPGNLRIQVFELAFDSSKPIKFEPLLSKFVGSIDLIALKELDSRLSDWGSPPRPSLLSLDEEGVLYVLDDRNIGVMVFDSKRRLMHAWRLPTTTRPTGIVPQDGDLWVLDESTHSILRAEPTEGRVLETISLDQDRGRPLALTPFAGDFLFTDQAQNQLIRVSRDGSVLSRKGEFGIGPGQFSRPHGIAILEEDKILISDYGNHRALILDREGVAITAFGPRAYTEPILTKKDNRTSESDE